MRAFLVMVLLAACTGTDSADPHAQVSCDQDWNLFAGTCELGCNEPFYASGSCAMVDPVGSITECSQYFRFENETGVDSYGCCVLDPILCQGKDCAVEFHECHPR